MPNNQFTTSQPPAIGYFYGPSGRQYKIMTQEERDEVNRRNAPPVHIEANEEIEDFKY